MQTRRPTSMRWGDLDMTNRDSFQYAVSHAEPVDPGSHLGDETARAFFFCQHFGMARKAHCCADCSEAYTLS
eukprot:4708687-Pyramimonas_sp.AAC.1